MSKVYDEYAKAKKMTSFSLTVLETIFELGDGCTQRQISDVIRYPKQSVNLAIKAFAEDGYIELREKPGNRRSKQIFFTPSGKEFCRKTVVPLLEKERFAISQMKESDRQRLSELLKEYGDLYCSSIKEITHN